MRNKMIMLYAGLFVFLKFGYLCCLATASSGYDHLEENEQNEGLLWKHKRYDSAELSSAQQIKYGGHGGMGGHAGGHAGGVGGGSSGEGNHGLTPVYAAGAARNHHNGGNSMRSYPLFTAIIWAVLEVGIISAFCV